MPAGDDVPVHVGHLIAKTGDIDLGGFKLLAHRFINDLQQAEELFALRLCEPRQLSDMPIHNEAQKARRRRRAGIDQPPEGAAPDHRLSFGHT